MKRPSIASIGPLRARSLPGPSRSRRNMLWCPCAPRPRDDQTGQGAHLPQSPNAHHHIANSTVLLIRLRFLFPTPITNYHQFHHFTTPSHSLSLIQLSINHPFTFSFTFHPPPSFHHFITFSHPIVHPTTHSPSPSNSPNPVSIPPLPPHSCGDPADPVPPLPTYANPRCMAWDRHAAAQLYLNCCSYCLLHALRLKRHRVLGISGVLHLKTQV